jgi:PAS domain S-box-containing protein
VGADKGGPSEDMQLIHALARRMTAALTPAKVLETAYRHIILTLKPDITVLFMLEEGRLVSRGERPSMPGFQREAAEALRAGECLCGLAAEKQQSVFSSDLRTDARCSVNACRSEGIVSFAALPLKAGADLLGVLGIGSRRPRNFEARADFLETIAAQVAVALKNAQLHEQVLRQMEELAQSKESLHRSEGFLQSMFNAIQDGISVIDPGLTILRVNAWMEQMYSDHMPLEGKKCFEVFQHRTSACPWCPSVKALETGCKQSVVVPYPDAASPAGWIDLSAFPLREADGRIVGVIEHVKDISAQKAAEMQLQEAYNIIRRSPSVAFVWENREGWPMTFVTENVEALFGYTSAELISGQILYRDMIHPDDLERVGEEVASHSRQPGQASFRHKPYRVLTRGGDERWVDDSTFIRRDAAGRITHYQGIVTDITERMQMELQLHQADRLDSIGRLAGGVAHDFNNLLMGIQGRTSLLLLDTAPGHPQLEHLRGIQSHVRSAAELTAQLLGFARGGKYEVRPVDLNELIRENVRMFGRTRKEITIHESCAPDLWTVEADPAQIKQVLLSLLVNACDAMPHGGDIHVHSENAVLSVEAAEARGLASGRYVQIAVEDTGTGMDSKTRQHIFEPFFTTKSKGRGTGLGLASAYGIIANHGGRIQVDSLPEQGATFTILLPASTLPPERKTEAAEAMVAGSGTVLLVDDEPMILDVGRRMLERLGYTVLTAAGGEEALEVFQRHKEGIRLVILDMVMPRMGGSDTFHRLKTLRPDLRVLLSSGYSAEAGAAELLGEGFTDFIQKPFSMEALSKKLLEILGNR